MPQLTFFGYPRSSLEHITSSTIVIVGSTCVSKSLHPIQGQENAVKILRKLSHEYDTHNLWAQMKLEDFDIVDLGDFSCNQLSFVVNKILKTGARVIVIGGDHTTTYYALRDANIKELLILDAHLDSEENKNLHHGSFVYRLLAEKRNVKLFLLGLRGYSTMVSEIEFLRSKDNVFMLPWPISIETLKFFIRRIPYISLDLDFFSPTTFPSVRVPEPLGFDFNDFIRVLNVTKANNIVYFDITEYSPDTDKNFVYGKLVIQLLLEVIAFIARSLS